MKTLKLIVTALMAYAVRALAAHAEFGPQQSWPAVQANFNATSYQYRVMRFDAAQTCNVASNAVSADGLEAPAGILQNNPLSGQAADIAYAGLSKAVAGAAITTREYITTNGSGKVITAVSGDMVMGRALEAVGAEDQVVSVLLFPAVRWGSAA